ncbi:PREDICTED: SLAM family member 6 [Nanorana parkeri]|uniref:SLAM family member 6 n=1 Tax=Nanorana parkeri TaxID=125878 RepID=UPI0008545623|nr:PREDICTED: SLAM family member 6 [Nanorana parkeri]
MFYFCCICFIVGNCFGLASQCGDSAIELNGELGRPFTFEKVVLKNGSETLTLQRTNKNQRNILLTYSQTSREPRLSPDGRYRYNMENSSFEILELQREDKGMYEIRVAHGSIETFCKYDLKVYEKINNVMVNVTHSLQNDTCIVTMDCVPQTGDNMTFSWTEDQKDLHYNNNSLLIRIPKDNATRNYSCRAENPVSSGSSEVNLMEICSKTPAASVNYYGLIYLITGVLAGILFIAIVGVLMRKRFNRKIGKHSMHPPQMPPPPNPASHTIPTPTMNTVYAAVQKKEMGITRPNEVPSEPVRQVALTLYDRVRRPESEDNPSTVYELAGPIRMAQ